MVRDAILQIIERRVAAPVVEREHGDRADLIPADAGARPRHQIPNAVSATTATEATPIAIVRPAAEGRCTRPFAGGQLAALNVPFELRPSRRPARARGGSHRRSAAGRRVVSRGSASRASASGGGVAWRSAARSAAAARRACAATTCLVAAPGERRDVRRASRTPSRRRRRCRRDGRRCGSAAACSGAMYAGVPSATPIDVSVRRRRAASLSRLGDAEVGDDRGRCR